ncbi:MAG: UxaA family hydrolase [Betaproteobacteria bacterium]
MKVAGRIHLVVDRRDNVCTLLDTNVQVDCLQGGMRIAIGVPFGHKIALVAIGHGDPVIKYGVTIGRTTEDVAPGEHVHVHNCV